MVVCRLPGFSVKARAVNDSVNTNICAGKERHRFFAELFRILYARATGKVCCALTPFQTFIRGTNSG